ncbi:MAG: hypothetical protein M1834_005642 [Cirrosporium novae-zelandiae]|nr:MAG: hypothetical protein M1834_005642 [Cirrosporium novae-zelandiae]
MPSNTNNHPLAPDKKLPDSKFLVLSSNPANEETTTKAEGGMALEKESSEIHIEEILPGESDDQESLLPACQMPTKNKPRKMTTSSFLRLGHGGA